MKLKSISIKTGISVFLCIILSKLLKLKYPFFVALPAFVPISNSAAESLKAGRNRILGTLIGAFTGVLFAFIKPGSSLLCGIGIIVIIYLCNYIRWGSSASIAGLVFISIMISIKGENPLLYSMDRISNTFLGIIVTIIVNNLMFRSNFVKEVEDSYNVIYLTMLSIIKEKICSNTEGDFNKLDDEIETVKKKLNDYMQEYELRKRTRMRVKQLKDLVDILICTNRHLKIISSIDSPFGLDDKNHKSFESLLNTDYNKKIYLKDERNIVFNYHLSEIFDKLSYVNGILKGTDLQN
jgi:uncharacterized membrane protein YgaE (UPF0421/DUF939 family)